MFSRDWRSGPPLPFLVGESILRSFQQVLFWPTEKRHDHHSCSLLLPSLSGHSNLEPVYDIWENNLRSKPRPTTITDVVVWNYTRTIFLLARPCFSNWSQIFDFHLWKLEITKIHTRHSTWDIAFPVLLPFAQRGRDTICVTVVSSLSYARLFASLSGLLTTAPRPSILERNTQANILWDNLVTNCAMKQFSILLSQFWEIVTKLDGCSWKHQRWPGKQWHDWAKQRPTCCVALWVHVKNVTYEYKMRMISTRTQIIYKVKCNWVLSLSNWGRSQSQVTMTL